MFMSERSKDLLTAGFIFFGVLLILPINAYCVVPEPPQKPQIAQNIPIPIKKPLVKSTETANASSSEETESSQQAFSFFDRITQGKGDDKNTQSTGQKHKEIFVLQRAGDFAAADEKIKSLTTSTLQGHILADRYLNASDYKVSFSELKSWMDLYADHPQAKNIYKKAIALRTNRSIIVNEPAKAKRIGGNLETLSYQAQPYKSTKKRTSSQERKVKTLKRDINRHINRNAPTLALNILSSDYNARFLDDVEYDTLLSKISMAYLHAGKYAQAHNVAKNALHRSGQYVPRAGWAFGLTAWQQGKYSTAAKGFGSAALSPYASGWMRAASSYWAARAHEKTGNKSEKKEFLKHGATYPKSFYGLLCVEALGKKPDFNWNTPSISEEVENYILSDDIGKRAQALIEAGERTLAAQELARFPVGYDGKKKQILLAYAEQHQLSDLLMVLGSSTYNENNNQLYNTALYPVTPWEPEEGYKVDRALMNAIIRQESRFQEAVKNPSGATGLMQIMPRTADYVMNGSPYQKASLISPPVNLEIGQRYIQKLLQHPSVENNLLFLAIAYNAGPGNLSKWKRELNTASDPLLFIETIPYDETRAFVERVMANYWIYRDRLNQQTPSLSALAKGEWPTYQAQDRISRRIASN